MQVNLNTQNNNTNFGKLYMPKQKNIAKTLGNQVAEQVEAGRNELKELSKDVNTYINPTTSWDKKLQGFEIIITDKVRNPIMLLLDLCSFTKYGFMNINQLKSKQDVKTSLIDTVKNVKKEFLDTYQQK